MADIFQRIDAVHVLKGKSILFLGDSIMRNIYKDLIVLLDVGSRNGLTKVDTIIFLSISNKPSHT